MSVCGDNIKRIRQDKKISQNKLARESGIAQSALSAIESSVKNPSVETIQLIAKALGVTISELFGESSSADSYTAEERQMISAYRTLTAQGREYIRQQIYVATQLYSGGAGVPVVENRKEG